MVDVVVVFGLVGMMGDEMVLGTEDWGGGLAEVMWEGDVEGTVGLGGLCAGFMGEGGEEGVDMARTCDYC